MEDVLNKFRSLMFFVIASIAVTGCATTAKVNSDQPYRVSKVVVSKKTSDIGTVNLPEDVRVKTIVETSKIANTGQPKTVQVSLTNFHAKNPLASLLIGDANSMSAEVTVIDSASGKQDANFKVYVTDSNYLQGVSGAVLAGLDNPVDVEQRLASLLSKDIAKNIFGSKYAHGGNGGAVASVQANYPRSYASLKIERECKIKKELASRNPDNDDIPKRRVKVPEYCKT